MHLRRAAERLPFSYFTVYQGVMQRSIDFDRVEEWEANLRLALASCTTPEILGKIAKSAPEYVEDARDQLFQYCGRDRVIDATLNWIRSNTLNAYHGTRLTGDEIQSIQAVGLVPLKAEARRARLERALSSHPRWPDIRSRLEQTLEMFGKQQFAGRREGQVHLTLSRSGLTNGFNHYLTYGAEFDQHVAQELLGDDGVALLANDGRITIVQVELSGDYAVQASHRYFSVEDMRSRGNVHNLVNEILKVWSFRLAHPDFDPRELKVDCGFVFNASIAPEWIRQVEQT